MCQFLSPTLGLTLLVQELNILIRFGAKLYLQSFLVRCISNVIFLTKLGRDKLRQGQPLGISQYAFGDTGVDYSLYNPNHPSGSDSYGSAITALPQLEAVPDDDVFLRSKLYGDGERGIQNFGFVDLPDGTTRTIQHIPKGIESTAIEIKPRVYSAGTEIPNTTFKSVSYTHLTLPTNREV